MAAEAEAKMFAGGTPSKEVEGDTFLTDLMMGKRPSESSRRNTAKSAMKPQRDDYSEQDLDEELRDVVFDYENSQALVAMANNFIEDDVKKRP